jgi:hypothetical protein
MPLGTLAVCLVLLILTTIALVCPAFAHQDEPTVRTAVWSQPQDPDYALAREISGAEGLPLAHALDGALCHAPAFLIWEVSPAFSASSAWTAAPAP